MDFGESDIPRPSGKENDGESGLPLVHQAAAQGDIDQLVKVVQEDPSMLELQDEEGFTPLAQAVQNQQLRGVKRLVKMGANINAQDNLGRTCLSIAAYQGWHEGVVYLLRNGSKKNICDKFGRIPLHAATYDTDRRALTVLLQSVSQDDVDQTDNELMTALHWAAFHDRPTHLQDIIDRGADIFAQDIDGKTPMHWAAQNGSKKCCEILASCQGGVDLINSADNSGKTPVHFAAAAGHSDIIHVLAGYPGCDLEVQDPDDRTPLHWATATGQTECLKALLELGVAPNQADAEGGTALEYARQSGHTECENLLVKKLGGKFGRTSKDSPTNTKKENSGPFSFIKTFFGKKKLDNSENKDRRSSSSYSPEQAERRKSSASSADDKNCEVKSSDNNGNVPNTTSNDSVKSVSVLVPTIRVQDPSEYRSCGKLSRPKKRSSKRLKHAVISGVDSNQTDDNSRGITIPSEDADRNDNLLREGVRKRSISPKPLLPLQARSMSLPHEADPSDPNSAHASRSRAARRTKSLQPLPDRPSLQVPEDSAPGISPPVSPKLLGCLEPMDFPVSPREGGLAPIRGHKPRPDMLVNSRVSALQKERSGANRTPTPPPSEVDTKILRLHSGVNTLLADTKSLSISHTRKSRKSLVPETEVELNSFPSGRRTMGQNSEHKYDIRGAVSPLASGEINMPSLHHRRRSNDTDLYSEK